MAWPERDPKTGIFRVRVRFRFPSKGGPKLKLPKQYNTRDPDTAHAKCVEVEETIRLIEQGRLQIPDGVDLVHFIGSGGRLTETPVLTPPPKSLTLGELCDAYLRELDGVEDREPTTYTERIHIAHLSDPSLLGSGRAIESIAFSDI